MADVHVEMVADRQKHAFGHWWEDKGLEKVWGSYLILVTVTAETL